MIKSRIALALILSSLVLVPFATSPGRGQSTEAAAQKFEFTRNNPGKAASAAAFDYGYFFPRTGGGFHLRSPIGRGIARIFVPFDETFVFWGEDDLNVPGGKIRGVYFKQQFGNLHIFFSREPTFSCPKSELFTSWDDRAYTPWTCAD